MAQQMVDRLIAKPPATLLRPEHAARDIVCGRTAVLLDEAGGVAMV
jgi:hypothetical protein